MSEKNCVELCQGSCGQSCEDAQDKNDED